MEETGNIYDHYKDFIGEPRNLEPDRKFHANKFQKLWEENGSRLVFHKSKYRKTKRVDHFDYYIDALKWAMRERIRFYDPRISVAAWLGSYRRKKVSSPAPVIYIDELSDSDPCPE